MTKGVKICFMPFFIVPLIAAIIAFPTGGVIQEARSFAYVGICSNDGSRLCSVCSSFNYSGSAPMTRARIHEFGTEFKFAEKCMNLLEWVLTYLAFR